MKKTVLFTALLLISRLFLLPITPGYAANQSPKVISIDPASGSSQPGKRILFTATYQDADGADNINRAYIRINTALGNGITAYYNQPKDRICLYDQEQKKVVFASLGEEVVLENLYGSIKCSKVKVKKYGKKLVIKWPIIFKGTLRGTKKTFLKVEDKSRVVDGWKQRGKWKITPAIVHLKAKSGMEKDGTSYIDTQFYKNGQLFYSEGGYGTGRGINIAVMHQNTGEIEGVHNFDTWYSSRLANPAMVEFLDDIPRGRIILAGVADEGSYLAEETYQKFESIGSKLIRDIEFRDEWLMITKNNHLDSIREKRTERDKLCWIGNGITLKYSADARPPRGSFLINNGHKTTKEPEVTLDLSGIHDNDSGLSRGSQMCFSNDGVNWSQPEDFQLNKQWYLDRGNGDKTVYAKFRDVNGNWNRIPMSAGIKLQDAAKIVKLGTDSYSNYDNKVMVNNNNDVYVIWTSYFSGKGLYFNASHDRGQTWLADPLDLSGGKSFNYPVIYANDNGFVGVAWHGSELDSYLYNIYLNYSTDYGATWLASPLKLTNTTDTDIDMVFPKIAGDNSGNVYVFWIRQEGYSQEDIYFTCSNDSGATWLTDNLKINKDVDPAGYSNPDLFEITNDSRGGVYIAWYGKRIADEKNGIYFNSSLDAGQTWRNSELKIDASGNYGSNIRLGCDDNGHVYAAWESGYSTSSVYFQHSADRGNNWLAEDKLATGVAYLPPYYRTISSSTLQLKNDQSGNIYIAWSERWYWHTYPSRYEVYFNRSTDYGANWESENIRIATGEPDQVDVKQPELICDNAGGVYINWYDDRNYHANDDKNLLTNDYSSRGYQDDLYLNYSKDFGENWLAKDIRLNWKFHKDGYYGYKSFTCDKTTGRLYTIWTNEGPLYCDIREP